MLCCTSAFEFSKVPGRNFDKAYSEALDKALDGGAAGISCSFCDVRIKSELKLELRAAFKFLL